MAAFHLIAYAEASIGIEASIGPLVVKLLRHHW